MVTEKLTENDLKLYDTIVEADKYLFIAMIMDKGYLDIPKIRTKIETLKEKVQQLRSEIFYQLYDYMLKTNKKFQGYSGNLPQQVYIIHDVGSSNSYKEADFFVIGNLPFEKQGYDLHDCEYVKEFRLKFPIYRYAFSDDNTHNDNEWEVNFTGWTDVTDWLKEGD